MEQRITFGSSGLDRASELRGNPEALAALLASPGARVLALWRGKLLVAGDTLALLPPGHPVLADASEAPILLGRDGDLAWFAQDISRWTPETEPSEIGAFHDPSVQVHPAAPEGSGFAELRTLMVRLDRRAAELAATAKAVLGWHEGHRFCARCGAATEVAQGGWQRRCPACNASHFPRTDPVVIMLVTHGNAILVGRSPGWPEGFYSCLAGFIDPGETIEAAVRREVWEEAGIRVGPVRYVASQPWPFPASLMLGCRAEALTTEITLDPAELEDARWIGREEMVQVFSGTHPTLGPPRRGAIAHSLVQGWLSDRLD